MEDTAIAAGFEWIEVNGAGTKTTLGSSGNLTDFKGGTGDTPGISDYTTYPITAGQNSVEKWILAHFIGTFSRVSDLRFWESTNFSPSTGLSVFWKGTQQIFLTPTNGTSSIATSSVPTSDPGSANVSIGGNLSGSLVASGYSDYIVLQLRTTTSATPGDTSLATFSLTYSEV